MTTVAQLTAQIGVEGADTAQSKIASVGQVTDSLDRKFSSFVPLNGGNLITNQDIAISKLNLIDAQVEKARAKLETLQNAADAGQSVTGIAEAQAKLELLEGKAQTARFKLQELGTQSEETGAELQSFAGASQEAGAAVEETGAKSEGAKFNLLDFGSKIGMVIFGLQGMVSMAMQAGQALLGPAISAETVTSSLTTMLGSTKAANKEMQQLDTFAAKTPFKTLDIDQAAEQMLGFGEKASNVIPEITAIGDALGSVGRDTPAQLNSVVDIFGKIRTEGHISAMTMNELAVHGINAWKALADGAGKTIPQVKNMVSKGLLPAKDAISDLTKGIEKNPLYKGGMARAAGTFTGLISTLLSNFDQLLASFASPIIKGLEGNLNNLGAALASPAFKEFSSKIGGGIVKTFQAIGSVFKGFSIGDLAKDFQKAIPVAGMLLPAFGILSSTIQVLSSHSKELGTWFKTSVIPAFKDAQPSFQALGDVITNKVAPAIHNLTVAFISNVLPVLMQIIPPVIRFAGVLAGALAEGIKTVWPYIVQISKALGQFASEVASRVQPIVQKFFQYLPPVLRILQGIWSAVWPSMAMVLQGVWQMIVGFVKVAWAIVTGIIKVGLDLLTGNWSQAWTDILDMFKGIWEGATTFLTGSLNLISGLIGGWVHGVIAFFQGLANTLVGHSIIPDMINAIISWFQQLPGRVMSAVTSLGGEIGGFFTGLASQAISWGSNIISGVISGLQNMAGNLMSAVAGLAQGIADHFPHSPAKTGPLRNIPLWGPKLVEMFSNDLKSHSAKARAAAEHMAKELRDAITFQYPEAIMKAKEQGNTRLAKQLQAQLSEMRAQMSMYKALIAQQGDSYSAKSNDPIIWGTGGKQPKHHTGGGVGTGANSILSAILKEVTIIANAVAPGGGSGGSGSFAGGGSSAGGYTFTSSMPNAPHLHVHPPAITIDGHLLTKHTMPHHVRHIREHTGHHH
jgi:tape measure domain-containing protein